MVLPPKGGSYRIVRGSYVLLRLLEFPMSDTAPAKRVLFICRLNRHRSATAERIFCKRKDLDVRSAGTEEDSLVRVNARMLDWANVIFTMDPLQLESLRRMFPAHPALDRVICLGIEDRVQVSRARAGGDASGKSRTTSLEGARSARGAAGARSAKSAAGAKSAKGAGVCPERAVETGESRGAKAGSGCRIASGGARR